MNCVYGMKKRNIPTETFVMVESKPISLLYKGKLCGGQEESNAKDNGKMPGTYAYL